MLLSEFILSNNLSLKTNIVFVFMNFHLRRSFLCLEIGFINKLYHCLTSDYMNHNFFNIEDIISNQNVYLNIHFFSSENEFLLLSKTRALILKIFF